MKVMLHDNPRRSSFVLSMLHRRPPRSTKRHTSVQTLPTIYVEVLLRQGTLCHGKRKRNTGSRSLDMSTMCPPDVWSVEKRVVVVVVGGHVTFVVGGLWAGYLSVLLSTGSDRPRKRLSWGA